MRYKGELERITPSILLKLSREGRGCELATVWGATKARFWARGWYGRIGKTIARGSHDVERGALLQAPRLGRCKDLRQ